MGNHFDPELGAALNGLFGSPPKPSRLDKEKPAKPTKPAGHAAVEGRDGNILRVKFGKG